MNRSRTQPHGAVGLRQLGFSIIELIAIVAILAILAALLIPAVARMKGSSTGTQCLSNLRSIGSLIHLYTQDHDGLMPGPTPAGLYASYEKGSINDPRNLCHFFLPYVDPNVPSGETRLMKQFVCPAALPLMDPSEAKNPRCYGVSGTRKNGLLIMDSPFGGRTGTTITRPPVKIQSLGSLSEIIAVFDRDKPSPTSSASAHETTRNFLFLDGHVRTIPLDKIISATEILP